MDAEPMEMGTLEAGEHKNVTVDELERRRTLTLHPWSSFQGLAEQGGAPA
jgi:hypothetical protein